jgi:hypothetical protein
MIKTDGKPTIAWVDLDDLDTLLNDVDRAKAGDEQARIRAEEEARDAEFGPASLTA